MTHPADVEVWPLLLEMAHSLDDTITARRLPPLDRVLVVPGVNVIVDPTEDCASVGWVRLVSAYPSSSFPTPDQTVAGACLGPLTAQVEVGVARCGGNPTTYPGGQIVMPTDAETIETASLQIADMVAIRAAINSMDTSIVQDVMAATYSPYGPAGGVVGGYWTAYLGA